MPDAPADTAQQPISSWLFMHVFRAAIVPALRRASVKLLSTKQARVTICTLYLRNYVAADSYVPSVPAGQVGVEGAQGAWARCPGPPPICWTNR